MNDGFKDLAEALITALSDGSVLEVSHSTAVGYANFYAEHGFLTPSMAVSTWSILSAAGVTPPGDEPVDDDSDFAEQEGQAPAKPKAFKKLSEVRFSVLDGKIHAKTPFKLKDICKSVPGARWNPTAKCWTWDAGPVAAENLMVAFKAHDPDTDDSFDALLGTMSKAAEHKTATNLPDIESTSTSAWMHQRQAYHFIKEMPAAALHMDMGTGKSLPAVARAIDVGGYTLIACPKKVIGVWPREFRRHGAVDVHIENGMRPKKRGGGFKALSIKERVEAFEELRRCDCGRPHVVILNYETLVHEPLKSWVASRDWDLFIMDESHRIKSPTGGQSKTCGAVAKRSKVRLQLTGTPMPHSPLDVFGQYRALDPSIFGHSFASFRNKYAIMGGYENKEILGIDPANLPDLKEKVHQFSFRVKADDVLDLPGVLPDEYLTCSLEGPQAKAYKDMADNFVAEFPGLSLSEVIGDAMTEGATVAPNVITMLLRLRQITGGSLKDDESGKTLVVGDAKEKLLRDWMEDFPQDEPLVVFAEFTHDLAVIRKVAEEQDRRYGEVSGRCNDLTEDSEYPTDVDVLAVQIQSGGAGVDLTRSRYACYYSVGYSNGNFRQSLKRLDRPGQTRPVRFTHLIVEDTVDVEVYSNLAEREETVGLVYE